MSSGGSTKTAAGTELTDRRFVLGAALITALGFAIRGAQVIWATGNRRLLNDAFYYYWQARYNSMGHWFIRPPFPGSNELLPAADHPPGFVLFLTGLDEIGIQSPLAQRFVIAILGTLTIVLIMYVMRRVVGRRSSLIAGLIAAIYPNLWVNDGRIMSETLFVCAFTASLACFYNLQLTHRWRWLIALAAALTIAASARPESVILFVLVLVPVVISVTKHETIKRIGMLSVAAAIPIVAFAPWVAFNSNRFHHTVFMSTGAGQTLLQGNCNATYYGKSSIGTNRFDCIPNLETVGTASTNMAQFDRDSRKLAIENMKSHLRRMPKVVIAREGRTWGLWRLDQQKRLDNHFENRGSLTTISWQQRSWIVLMTLAIPGAFVFRRRRIPLYPLLAQVGLTVAVTSITFGSTRYRAGVEVVIVLLAAATIDACLRRLLHRS